MINAKQHFIIYPLFQWLTGFLLKRNFNSVSIDGAFQDTAKPILVVSNHISWWDGFWLMHLNLKCLHRRFHFMMQEENLKKHWYFQYTGAFSVKKNSRSIIESINYTLNILQKNENMVFMFPQGEIKSMHEHNVKFEKGINRIIESCDEDIQVLFVANLVDYFSTPKPNLYMYIKSETIIDLKNQGIEKVYNTFYDKVLNLQKMKTS